MASLSRRSLPAAAAKGLLLETVLPERSRLVVQGNRAALANVVRNLIENAIKFSNEGARIEVSLALAGEGRCRISVSDTGQGIPADEIPGLFTPFFRATKHRQSIAGSGLGLAVARRIVESHAGTIAVRSEDGKGSTFTVELPCLRSEPSGSEAVPSRRKVVVIGGVTSGPKAAARLRRLEESADITIIEKSDLFSYAGCGLPYYIGGQVRSPKALMASADNSVRDVEWFATIRDITVMNRTEAVAINRARREVAARNLVTGATAAVPYDVLVLATGAVARVPPIPGLPQEGVYSLYSIRDAEQIRAQLAADQAKDICIIGAGLIAAETVEPLMSAGARVTLLEKEQTILSHLYDPEIGLKIQGMLSHKGIKIVTGAAVSAVERESGHLVVRSNRGSFQADLVILAAGVQPNVALAVEAGLEIGPTGGVRVNDLLQTSDERIYAVGDCAETLNTLSGRFESWPLGSISTKMGRMAADNIAGRRSPFSGFIGTAMVKIFDLCAGRTGLSESAARAAGFDAITVLIAGADKSPYTGSAHPMIIKLVADRGRRVLLGAQGYGTDIFARIPVLACAISQGMTVDDFFRFDFGYSPAFNTSIDIAQTACLVLANKIDGLLNTMSIEELERRRSEVRLVDVSPFSEHALGAIPGSLNVPLESLRVEGVPYQRQESIVLYSRTSAGAYEALCYLRSQGYERLAVLEGGAMFWEQ